MLPVAAAGLTAALAISYFAGPRNTSPMTGPDGKTYRPTQNDGWTCFSECLMERTVSRKRS
jgi:hypothetical protein